MPGHDLVVVGASAGGIEALRTLCSHLPADLPATICVVLHVPSTSTSVLPAILTRSGPLPAFHAQHGEPLQPGRIYVAPPNNHLLVSDSHLALSKGSAENNHRPAIDPLFRSAARAKGSRVIGVLLSGADDDGTEGALVVKARGGVVLVQDPEEAIYRRMPESVMAYVKVDGVLPLTSLAIELVRLVRQEAPADAEESPLSEAGGSAVNEHSLDAAQDRLNTVIDEWLGGENERQASGFVCPACGGGIWMSEVHSLLRFGCHTGHRFSPDSFNQAQSSLLERTLWQAVAMLEQRVAFMHKMAGQADEQLRPWAAERYRTRASELEPGTELLRRLLDHSGAAPLAPEADEI